MDFVQTFDQPPHNPAFNLGGLSSTSGHRQPHNPAPPPSVQQQPQPPQDHTLVPSKLPVPKADKPEPPHPQSHPHHHVPFSYSFDIDSYPMTNPPLFDSTMYLNYNDGAPQLRRRISISNGQIGQIVSHEAVFDDSLGFDNEDVHVKVENPALVVDPQQAQQEMAQDFAYVNHMKQNAQRQLDLRQAQIQQKQAPPVVQPPPSQSQPFAGVPPPNHQLIYNNEVIFNPNNGPIPGTAAWKKDRLLERNRVAASKCRQRKKEAQKQLAVELQEIKSENEKLKTNLENYSKFYALVQKYFSNTSKFETSKNYEMYELINGLVSKSDESSLLKSLGELQLNQLTQPSNDGTQ